MCNEINICTNQTKQSTNITSNSYTKQNDVADQRTHQSLYHTAICLVATILRCCRACSKLLLRAATTSTIHLVHDRA